LELFPLSVANCAKIRLGGCLSPQKADKKSNQLRASVFKLLIVKLEIKIGLNKIKYVKKILIIEDKLQFEESNTL
jgi:hypothetical protein